MTGTGKHFAEAVRLLQTEAEAIRRAAMRLDEAKTEEAIALLAACQGKVVLTGVGKSGNIAQKIAATLTSTGTVAVYLHPSDALHGGLGLVARGDAVLALSYSGETDEIVAILPYLKRRGVPVISIIGNVDSTLGRESAVALDASVEREACPLGLAPTASTTVALALGDALAVCLMNARGWTPEDFALNHPAGRIGKRLTLTVGDLMHTGRANPIVSAAASWIEIVRAISRGGLGAVSVTDEAGVLTGIITDGDVRRAIERCRADELELMRAETIMTPQPVVTAPDTLAYDALRLMEDRPSQIAVLPVVGVEGHAVGLVRLHDIIRSGL